MAVWCEFDHAGFADWLKDRPEVIKDLARRVPPDRLYKLKPLGQRVYVISYDEDGTLSVAITGQFNHTLFSRQVFGIKPDDLEECALPGPDEDLGDTAAEAGYSQEDIETILLPKIKEHLAK